MNNHKDINTIWNPTVTKKSEFIKLIRKLKPNKQDIFYDLGCGYAHTCMWMQNEVKLAFGVESNLNYYNQAKKRLGEKNTENIHLIHDDYENVSLKNATIIYTTLFLEKNFIDKIQKSAQCGMTFVFRELPPPYPIKSYKFENFFIFKTPYEITTKNEYAQIFLGQSNVTMDDMHYMLNLGRDLQQVEKFQKTLPV